MICFVSYAMNFRKENLDAFVKKYGIKLGFMSIFSKASAYALQDQPVVNAVIDGQVKNSIEKKKNKPLVAFERISTSLTVIYIIYI